MYWFLFIALVVILVIAFLLRKRSSVKKITLNSSLSTEELQRRKLEYEMIRLENEMSNRDFEGAFKKYTGPVVLVLGFVGAVLAYVTQIGVYVGNLNKNEKVQYTEIQIKAMENLGSANDWTQKAGIRVLKTMEVDAVDILVERLNSIPKLSEADSIERQGRNISIALGEIYKTITGRPEPGADLITFNTRVEKSIGDAILYYKENNAATMDREAPLYNNASLVGYLCKQFKDAKLLELKNKIVVFLNTLSEDSPVRKQVNEILSE